MKPDHIERRLGEILSIVTELQAEVRALRGESSQRRQERSARQIRYENRRALLRQLATACGPVSWDTAESVRLAESLPQATLVIIPDCGHVPQEECPEPFLAAATEFFASLLPIPSP